MNVLQRFLEFLKPPSSSSWNEKGKSLAKRRNYTEAIVCFDKALELDNQYSNAWFNKGLCLEATQQYKQALDCYNQAIHYSPRDPDIRKRQARLTAKMPPSEGSEEQSTTCNKYEPASNNHATAPRTPYTSSQKSPPTIDHSATSYAERLEKRRNAIGFNFEQAGLVDASCRSQKNFLLGLTPYQFEDAIAKLFKDRGFSVQQTPYSNDGGKDIILQKGGLKYLVECKQWSEDKKIGRPELMILFAAMCQEKAVSGYFVTTANFSVPATEYGVENHIELIDGSTLATMMQETYPSRSICQSVQQMCVECNQILMFHYNNWNEPQKCDKGHVVVNRVTRTGEYLGL